MENNATKMVNHAKSHVLFQESWCFFPGKKPAFTTMGAFLEASQNLKSSLAGTYRIPPGC